jgi:hypothetical protein
MSLSMSSTYAYSTFDKKFDMEEEEKDIAIILAFHKNKRPKHGASVFGRERLWWARIEGDHRLVNNYFMTSPVYPERYFHRHFGWERSCSSKLRSR